MPGQTRDDAASLQKWAVQLRKGCLELAILACLWSGKLYGLEILRRLADDSSLMVPEGTVYPLLSRLKAEGWVDSEWVEADAGQRHHRVPCLLAIGHTLFPFHEQMPGGIRNFYDAFHGFAIQALYWYLIDR